MENLHGHHHLHQAAAHNAYQYQYQYAPVASTTATLSTPQGPPPLSLTHPSHHHFQSGSSQLLLGQHHHPHVHHHHLTHPLTNTPSLAATMNPSPLSNSSSSSINAESVTTGGSLRRDTEVERIRFRLMLLEQQQQQQQHIQPTNQHLPTTPNTVPNTTNIDECIAALVRSQINSSIKSSEDKNNQLEALLNQREYEIKEMKSKFGAEKARMESDVSQLKSAVNSRDEELLSEKMRYSSLQKEHEKLKQKLNDTTRYLSELATKEETRELRDELKMAREEIEKQKDNINNYEDKLTKAKLTVKEKMHEIKEGKEALEREKLGKEKLRIEFENYKQMTKSVGEIVEKLEQNASLSAELECAKKLLTGLQEKMSNQQVKYEKQIGDLKESLRQQTDLYTSTKSELEKREETIRDFQVSLKELASENEELISKNSTLSDKMKAFEALLSADSMKVLRLLFKEMNECTSELDSLVRICMDINEGKEIDCCTLLGSATRRSNDYLDLSGSDETILQMIDSSHLMKKTNELREVRKKLKELKSSVADRVAEKIGSNVSCITQ